MASLSKGNNMKTLPIDFWIGTIGFLIAFYIIERGFK